MSHLSDKEILKIYNEGNQNYAFNLLVRKYQTKIYVQIRRMVHSHEDTDDVLQNTFVKVWKGMGKFRGQSQLSTWLYRIAANEAITFINKNKKRISVSLDNEINNIEIPIVDNFSEYSGDKIQAILLKIIADLPPKQRLVFNLKYYEDLKYDEIAEIVGGSIGSLKASYFHAVKKIEESIKHNSWK